MTVRPGGDLDTALRRSLGERTCSIAEVDEWLSAAEGAGDFSVESRSLSELDSWTIDPDTHDLSHASGRFFAIRGADVAATHAGIETRWQQPVIVQPDVGILGLVAAPIQGALHFLVQAKMEPGNRRLVQVSPTVQATASNFERVHRGLPIPFLECFQGKSAGHIAVLVDQLQAEQGTRYLHKRNRNTMVVVDPAVLGPVDSRFRWLTLADLTAVAEGQDLLHMDTRSILGSLPLAPDGSVASLTPELTAEVGTWLTDLMRAARIETNVIPLREVAGWSFVDGRFASTDPSPFDVLGVRVATSHREISTWDQPLVRNSDGARMTLLIRRTNGATEALIVATSSMGVRDGVELGPSIVEWPPGEHDVALDDGVETAGAAAHGHVWFDNDLPEEGGRFFHSSTNHRIIEVLDAKEVPNSPTRCWVGLDQLRTLGSTTSLLNMELRSLLACLPLALRMET